MRTPRPTETTETQEIEAWSLRTRCWSHYDIAKELKLSVDAVQRALKRVGARRVKQIQADLENIRGEHHDQLMFIASAALTAWQQATKEESDSRATDGPITSSPHHPITPSRRVSAYLKVALQALNAVRSLWGLDAAKKMEVNAPQTQIKALVGIDIDRMMRRREPKEPRGLVDVATAS